MILLQMGPYFVHGPCYNPRPCGCLWSVPLPEHMFMYLDCPITRDMFMWVTWKAQPRPCWCPWVRLTVLLTMAHVVHWRLWWCLCPMSCQKAMLMSWSNTCHWRPLWGTWHILIPDNLQMFMILLIVKDKDTTSQWYWWVQTHSWERETTPKVIPSSKN